MAIIDVSIACDAWHSDLPDAAGLARRAAAEALAVAAPSLPEAAELSLVLEDDAAVQALNRRYRGRDAPTNVLSFPAWAGVAAAADSGAGGPPPALGDVVVAHSTLRREAAAQRKPLAHHLVHLVVHGTLHLLGHDHQNDADAATMETLETSILARIGVPDPYADEQAPSVFNIEAET